MEVLLWLIMMFLSVLLVSIPTLCVDEDQEVLYYEDIQSVEMREEFDRAPLISRTVTKSDWCTVKKQIYFRQELGVRCVTYKTIFVLVPHGLQNHYF